MATFINNVFVENKDALLHVADLSMQRGYGVFDFCRTVNGVPLFLEDHLDRLYESAKKMHLQLEKDRGELKSIIHELITKRNLSEAGIRIMLTGGFSPDGYNISKPNLIITCNPVKTASPADFEKGFSVVTHHYQRELPQIKSINYLMAVWLQPLLKEQKAHDVLYYNVNSITEFPRSNVFVVTKNGHLVTPVNNILFGITRKQILSFAPAFAKVEQRDISIDELKDADEVFLSSTTKRIMPVVSINGKQVGDGTPGALTRKIYERFLELEKTLVS